MFVQLVNKLIKFITSVIDNTAWWTKQTWFENKIAAFVISYSNFFPQSAHQILLFYRTTSPTEQFQEEKEK
jgi:hypothetical protein